MHDLPRPSIRRFAGAFAAAALALWVALAVASPAAADSSRHDLVLFGNSGRVEKGQELTGDAVVFGGSLDVYGKIDGDAVVIGGTLHLHPDSDVGGSLVSMGGTLIDDRPPGRRHNTVKVMPSPHHGVVVPPPPMETPQPPPTPEPTETPYVTRSSGSDAWADQLGQLWFLLVVTGLSLLSFLLFGGAAMRLYDTMLERPIPAVIVGFFWPFIYVVILVVLCITLIGILLLPVQFIAFFVAYLLGRAAIGLFIGRKLFEAMKALEPSPFASCALGLGLIGVIEAILPAPMGNIIDLFVIGSIAIGAAILTVSRRPPWAAAPPPASSGGFMPPATTTSGPPVAQ